MSNSIGNNLLVKMILTYLRCEQKTTMDGGVI